MQEFQEGIVGHDCKRIIMVSLLKEWQGWKKYLMQNIDLECPNKPSDFTQKIEQYNNKLSFAEKRILHNYEAKKFPTKNKFE